MAEARRGTRADGEVTRKRIPEIAVERFAATGYAAATGKETAPRAGVDLA